MPAVKVESLSVLRAFLADITKIYHRCPQLHQWMDQTEGEQLASLALGDALLRDLAVRVEHTVSHPQIAVIGPTQAGKSSVVNALLGKAVAQASPLAGYTRHAHGFQIGGATNPFKLAPVLTGELVEPPPAADRYDHYCLTGLPTTVQPSALSQCTVWDTPDFDSLTAHQYQRSMLEVCALADVVLIVVSKEKYADRSVWNIMRMLLPLQRPMILCINKMSDDAQTIIEQDVAANLASIGATDQQVQITSLPYIAQAATELNTLIKAATYLKQLVQTQCTQMALSARAVGVQLYLREHWQAWTHALQLEQLALQHWKTLVEQQADTAMHSYRRDFLDHPHRFDSLKRVMVELLYLLEIPGLASPMTKIRGVLTWPARQLLRGKSALQGQAAQPQGSEEQIIKELYHGCINRHLASMLECSEAPQASPYWEAIHQHLQSQRTTLHERFDAALASHQDQLHSEIQAAANQLYSRLQEQPMLLNSLRAARVTADAAGIALAIKTAGLGVHDLLFAPAMVTLSSLLAESALGEYLKQVTNELKNKHATAVENDLFHPHLSQALLQLNQAMQAECVFNIDAKRSNFARQCLNELTYA